MKTYNPQLAGQFAIALWNASCLGALFATLDYLKAENFQDYNRCPGFPVPIHNQRVNAEEPNVLVLLESRERPVKEPGKRPNHQGLWIVALPHQIYKGDNVSLTACFRSWLSHHLNAPTKFLSTNELCSGILSETANVMPRALANSRNRSLDFLDPGSNVA